MMTRGMLELKQAGARTAAQDEETCIVFGMPKRGDPAEWRGQGSAIAVGFRHNSE